MSHHRLGLLSVFILFVSAFMGDGPLASDQLQRIEPNKLTGTSSAVVVDGGSLIHTVQFLPLSVDRLSKSTSAVEQLSNVLEQLQAAIGDSSLSSIARLNLYVTSDNVAEEVRRVLPSHFPGEHQPTVSLVVTGLPMPGAVVALDAVACGPGRDLGHVRQEQRFAVLPSGSRIYVSGQAEQSDSLAEATGNTLRSLHNTLDFLGRSDEDIVQLKVFVQPMSDAEVVREQVRKFFKDKSVPPLVMVEWKSSRTTPVEIELIAWGGPANEGLPAMEFLTPPGMTTPAVYCRVCRINDPRSIYVSGLSASQEHSAPVGSGADADQEVKEIFASLNRILTLAGSDFEHLGKATYYVSTEAASISLNKLRPDYYNPARPPAASKAMVESVGVPGLELTLDMIAVPGD